MQFITFIPKLNEVDNTFWHIIISNSFFNIDILLQVVII